MKRSLLFGTFIVITFSFLFFKSESQMSKKEINIILSGQFDREISPDNISTIPLYHINYNIWNTLVTDEQKPAIAKSFRISEDKKTYLFDLDENAKFSNGDVISAEDVKFSIERLMSRSQNGHINARTTIESIRILSPQQIEIKLFKPTLSFIYLVGLPEFGIVSQKITPQDGQVDLKVTSGAYFVEKIDDKNQVIKLKRNSFFKRHVEQSPDVVNIFFKTDGHEIVRELNGEKKYQFAEMYDSYTEVALKEVDNTNYSHVITKPSLSELLLVNLDRVSKDKALVIYDSIQKKFPVSNILSYKKSNQLLPPKTFGSLNHDEIPKIDVQDDIELPKELTLRAFRPKGRRALELKDFFEKQGTVLKIISPKSTEEFDLTLWGQGMNSDYPEIELYLAILSPYGKIRGNSLIKNKIDLIVHETNIQKKSDLIKEVGKEILKTGEVIPLTIKSYAHFFRDKEISIKDVSDYDGDIPFYRMKVK